MVLGENVICLSVSTFINKYIIIPFLSFSFLFVLCSYNIGTNHPQCVNHCPNNCTHLCTTSVARGIYGRKSRRHCVAVEIPLQHRRPKCSGGHGVAFVWGGWPLRLRSRLAGGWREQNVEKQRARNPVRTGATHNEYHACTTSQPRNHEIVAPAAVV